MSRALQYPSKCSRCQRLMGAGEEADFFPDGNGGYLHVHADGEEGCEAANAPVVKPRTRRRRFLRECGTAGCYGMAGIAYDGGAPKACPHCGGPWVWEQDT